MTVKPGSWDETLCIKKVVMLGFCEQRVSGGNRTKRWAEASGEF